MSDNNGGGETGAFLAGFILGGLVGAAVAMIMAPMPGSETRKQIMDKGLELRGLAESRIEEARKRAEEAGGDIKSRAGEVAGDVRRHGEELQERSRVILEEQKSKLASAIEQGKEAADEGDVPTAPNGESPAA